MKTCLITVSFLILSGCAHQLTREDYSHSKFPEEKSRRDSAACELEATKNAGIDMTRRQEWNVTFDACMRSKGYAKK